MQTTSSPPAAQRRLDALSAQVRPAAAAASAVAAAAAAAGAAGASSEAAADAHMGSNVMANTVIMPSIGLGCAYVADDDGRSQWDIATEMVEAALQAGFRHFDTAQRYGTEAPLGAVLRSHFKAGTLRREDVFVTTKTSNPRPGSGGMPAGGGWVPEGRGYMVDEASDAYAGLTAELEGCLETLQFDYVDLVLMHYPSLPSADGPGLSRESRKRKRRECWAALQDLYWSGKCRAIGVSNFGQNHLEELFSCAFAFEFPFRGCER
jgi:diketogulonate reductase-like aldo/keto reductase